MADGDLVVVRDSQREHARHAVPFVPLFRHAMDFVVGRGDRLTHTRRDIAFGPFELLRNDLDGGLRRQLAGGTATHAVHDKEDASRVIHVHAVFVVAPPKSGIAGRAGSPAHR